MDKILEVRDLKVGFFSGKNFSLAVSGVDLELYKNETLVIAGESGSGKTICALSLMRILPENARIISGSVIFDGKQILDLDSESLRRIRGKDIAYVFQEPTSFLNPVYTIGGQIQEAIVLHQKIDKKQALSEARELLLKVKIKDPERVLKAYPHQLSGGMNQRAFIAMGLASKPKVLVADEPTTSLDVTTEAEILNLLVSLKASLGLSIIFITHNLSIAKKIADRILIMHRGKIVEEGSCDSVFRNPHHFHTRELIAAYEKIGKL